MKRSRPYTESWLPTQPGDIITGTIIDVGEKPINDDFVPYIEIVTPDEKQVQILMSTAALYYVFNNVDLDIGDLIEIEYEGESQSIKKANNALKLFSIGVEDKDGVQKYPVPIERKKAEIAAHRNKQAEQEKAIDEKLKSTADSIKARSKPKK